MFKQQEKIRIATEAFGLFLVVSFSLGFLIVNLHLSRFGFYDYSFLRLKYISAGIICLFLVASLLTVTYGLYKTTKNFYSRIKKKDLSWLTKRIFNVIFTPIAIGVWGIFIYTIWGFVTPTFSHKDSLGVLLSTELIPKVRLDFLIWIILLFVLIYFLTKLVKHTKSPQGLFWDLDGATDTFSVFSISLVMLLFFSFGIYPYIPQYLGGGQSTRVELMFKKDFDVQEFEPSAKDNKFTTDIIYQTPDILLIQTSSSTFSFNSSELTAIRYIDSKKNEVEQYSKKNQTELIEVLRKE